MREEIERLIAKYESMEASETVDVLANVYDQFVRDLKELLVESQAEVSRRLLHEQLDAMDRKVIPYVCDLCGRVVVDAEGFTPYLRGIPMENKRDVTSFVCHQCFGQPRKPPQPENRHEPVPARRRAR